MRNLKSLITAALVTVTFVASPALAAAATASLPHGTNATPTSTGPAFTISPGGNITAKAGKTTLKDTGKTTLKDKSTGATLTCTSSTATGTLQSGFSLPGASVGTITATTFTSCTGPLGLTFTVTQAGTWALNLTMSAAGVSTGYLSNVSAQLSGSGCSATVAGAVDLRYTSQTRKLSVKPIANSGNVLTTANVSGCAGLINNGDKATFTGLYAVAPPQIIIMGATNTPPAIAAGACPTPGVTLTPVAPAPNLAKLQTASLTSNVTRTVPANATSVTVSLLGFLNRGLDSVAVAFAAPGAVSCLTTTVTYQVGCNANSELVFATLVDGKGETTDSHDGVGVSPKVRMTC